MRFKNLTGMKFGRLTVIKRVEDHVTSGGNKLIQYLVRCDCGNERIVLGNNLTKKINPTRSCGCLQKEELMKRSVKHGRTGTRLFEIWQGIKKRCKNPNAKNYKYYGGKGVIICKEWEEDFMNFYNWSVCNGYSDNLTIDRINSNGNYEPDNCRWVSMKVQNNNSSNCCYLTYKGETHTMKEWAEIKNINYSTLKQRINMYKWDIEKALETPIRKYKEYKYMH